MMGYLPSFFQKRVLRYALFRLNIIDADALGLDQLDITWGKKSTFEFRDVGLQLEASLSARSSLRSCAPCLRRSY